MEHKVHVAKFIWLNSTKDSSVFLSKKQEQQLVEKAINDTEARKEKFVYSRNKCLIN
jgi:exonuclease SbcC